MTPPRTNSTESHPYLRAASAGLRHHTKTQHRTSADRAYLDLLHAHLIAGHQLLDSLADATAPRSPAAGRDLAAARTRLWQAAAAVHDAFHSLPLADLAGTPEECRPEQLLDGPPFVTICQRNLSAVHAVRRKTTPTQLDEPLHGHTTTCAR